MPHGAEIVTMGIDVYEGAINILVTDGRAAVVPIGPDRSVADIWLDFRAALGRLDLDLDIWEKPQEVTDTTPFSENTHDHTFVAEDAQRFVRLLASVDSVFEEFRSRFFGRSGVQFWWGGFDLAMLLFTGKHEKAPGDRGYIMRYDLDAEHLNAGFWPGDDENPHPAFYGYLVPRPRGCEKAPISCEHAGWVETMGEWVLPYQPVRASDDPRGVILTFLEDIYGMARRLAKWDVRSLSYERPGPAPRGKMKAA